MKIGIIFLEARIKIMSRIVIEFPNETWTVLMWLYRFIFKML